MAPTGYTAYAQTAADLVVTTATVESTDVLVVTDSTSIDVYASDLTTQITDLKDSTEASVTSAPISGGVIQRFYAPDDYDTDGVWVQSDEGWVNLRPLSPASSGGGSGTVTSVDGISPDGDGNVDLGLADVATSGSYDDLTDTPTLKTVATSGDASDLLNFSSTVVSNFAGVTVMYFYDGGWPTVPDSIANNTQISKHFVGGDTSHQPPSVKGNRIWDRPVA